MSDDGPEVRRPGGDDEREEQARSRQDQDGHGDGGDGEGADAAGSVEEREAVARDEDITDG